MNWHTRITVDLNICHGKACIKGTRIPVTVILANLAAGTSSKALSKTYPGLTTDAVCASLAYATDLASGDSDCQTSPASIPRTACTLHPTRRTPLTELSPPPPCITRCGQFSHQNPAALALS